MADEVDLVQENVAMENDAHVRLAVRAAADIPVGEPGICFECDEESKRLVRGRCAPCREGRVK
jgi:hypothetical protein